ncbi:MAG: hypothetical protein KGJ37_02535 [Verrucomicrobiota bacterium]|nr:hypothetical protein [Verrucomicrobiota bacterium]
MASSKPFSSTPATVVRYPLRAMLDELKLERTSGAFSQEKLDQIEISKLFASKPRRRAKTKK